MFLDSWVVGVGCWCGLLVCVVGVLVKLLHYYVRLVLVGGVGSKCFLIPGLLVWTLVWVGGVGCWRGISKLRRCDHHPCEVLRSNQCPE